MGTGVTDYDKAVKKAEQQNLKGFEGDVFMKEKFQHIIETYGIKTFIETGTYLGATSRIVSDWVDKVYTIELNTLNFARSKNMLQHCKNVDQWGGNSPECLREILKRWKAEHFKSEFTNPTGERGLTGALPLLFIFLDAHWDDYNPLLDELAEISKAGIKPIIAIHDFKVPGREDLGFDTYKGQDYDLNWITNGLLSIYGHGGYSIEYNSEASGAKRGVVYVYPEERQPLNLIGGNYK